MNAESTAVLHDMISETIPEIQGGGNHPPWYNMSQKYLGSLRVNFRAQTWIFDTSIIWGVSKLTVPGAL